MTSVTLQKYGGGLVSGPNQTSDGTETVLCVSAVVQQFPSKRKKLINWTTIVMSS